MKYFLDSAIIEDIKCAYNTFGIDGVTTNPRHIMASGKPFMKVIEEIADWIANQGIEGICNFPVSVEINPHLDNVEEMILEAKMIASVCPNFVIKIPCTQAGVTAARILESDGIRTNLTLVFSPSQALWAARNNSFFVSPFIGWKESNGEDCKKYIRDIVSIYRNYDFYGKTQIICAALRSSKQIVDCAIAGADIVTTSFDVFVESMNHAYTYQGLKIFADSWDNTIIE